ncbi:MAG: hypothetical protein AAFR88_08705 [Pseudomonadota bacterium]
MTKRTCVAAFALALSLSACGGTAEETPTNDADDFAARINNGNTQAPAAQAAAPAEMQAPQIAQPLPDAAPGQFVPGTATDPESATCGANRMGQFLNRPADDATRAAIMEVASDVSEIRFVAPGAQGVRPDPTHPRLNIMIDTTGVIRDARCG